MLRFAWNGMDRFYDGGIFDMVTSKSSFAFDQCISGYAFEHVNIMNKLCLIQLR